MSPQLYWCLQTRCQCEGSIIVAFTEELSVSAICLAAVILVFAEEVSV